MDVIMLAYKFMCWMSPTMISDLYNQMQKTETRTSFSYTITACFATLCHCGSTDHSMNESAIDMQELIFRNVVSLWQMQLELYSCISRYISWRRYVLLYCLCAVLMSRECVSLVRRRKEKTEITEELISGFCHNYDYVNYHFSQNSDFKNIDVLQF